MATRYAPWARALRDEVKEIEGEHRALRKELKKIERSETQLYRRLERLLGNAKPSHIMVVEHRPGEKDRVTRHPLTSARSLRALAKPGGSSPGLFCGCELILSSPQPDGSLDVCVLIDCSNEPEKTGFRCSYWCFTVSPPVVAVAKKAS